MPNNDAVAEAVRFYREALEVLTQLPPTEENQREQIGLVLSMKIPWGRIGYSEDYLPLLQKAEALAEALGDDKKGVQIRSVLGSYFIVRGGVPQLGWKYLERSLEDSEIIQDVELLIPIVVELLIACAVSGDFQRVNQMAPTIISLIEDSGTQAMAWGSTITRRFSVFGARPGECAGTLITARDCWRKPYPLPSKSVTGYPGG